MLVQAIKVALWVIFGMTVERALVLVRSAVAGVYAELQRKPCSTFLVVLAGQS